MNLRKILILSLFLFPCFLLFSQGSNNDPLAPLVSGAAGQEGIPDTVNSLKTPVKQILWILTSFALLYAIYFMIGGDVKKGFSIFLGSAVLCFILSQIIDNYFAM